MFRLPRVLGLCLLSASLAGPALADRRLAVTDNADYPGHDYKTLKEVSREVCETACLDDRTCKAFTYNTSVSWCFLKDRVSEPVGFDGAVAGRVLEARTLDKSVEAQRLQELKFLTKAYRDERLSLKRDLEKAYGRTAGGYDDLVSYGISAASQNDFKGALSNFGAALLLDETDPVIWIRFATAALYFQTDNWNDRYQKQRWATAAAIQAYLATDTGDRDRASILSLLGKSLEVRSAWRDALRTYRASLDLVEDQQLRAVYNDLVGQHGFRVTSHQVDSESNTPRLCVNFSDPLPKAGFEPGHFVTIPGIDGLAVEHSGSQICIDGVEHGKRYRVSVRSGLPSADGEALLKSAELNLYVRDRSPWVGFSGRSYVLPNGEDAGIPVQTVNTDSVEAVLYRLGERNLPSVLDGRFLKQLTTYQAEKIANTSGEELWRGHVDVRSSLNQTVTTNIPVRDLIKDLQPGLYVLSARPAAALKEEWKPQASQWFIVSDIGLTSFTADDGLHVFARSLGTAEVLARANVRLVAKNNEVLGQTVTDAQGYAKFASGLLRGKGGNQPRLVMAELERGDYAFLDIAQAGFDLTDRGVAGRAAPGAVDLYLTTERGIYRPGERVHATVLARDRSGKALQDGLPLTAVLERPDGVEFKRTVIRDGGAGGYYLSEDLPEGAALGTWTLKVHTDVKRAPVATATVLVEDFLPDRLKLDVDLPGDVLDPDGAAALTVQADFLYGAPGAGLKLDGEVRVKPFDGDLPGLKGYRFGLHDDPSDTRFDTFASGVLTDDSGKAGLTLSLPPLPRTTRLYEAVATIRLHDTNGRTVEQQVRRPVRPDGTRLGIRPLFDGNAVDEGGTAEFDLALVDGQGHKRALKDVSWTLERLNTDYQWYFADGAWRYEPVTNSSRVASGTLDLTDDQANPLSVPVDWGRYRLEVRSGGQNATASSMVFDAGWYAEASATPSPDFLDISTDNPRYGIGEDVKLRINPRFAGQARISVLNGGLVHQQVVDVPEEGATVSLPVTENWGTGAYVTATLYRGSDREAGRLPQRALGIQWVSVDASDRTLAVTLDVPDRVDPRGPLTVPLSISNSKPGEAVFVTLAAVDVGILTLTDYQSPDPASWYYGQRALGVGLHDLYGYLLDPWAGEAGRVRSGGDGVTGGMKGKPPTQRLLAFHSGIVEVGPDGRAEVTFDLPDFNGTVRLMAMAWSASSVGRAEQDVLVNDPVVLTASTPRFLAPGDQSRVLVELANVRGPSGDYALTINPDRHLSLDDPAGQFTLTLEKGARVSVPVGLTARVSGEAELALSLKGPDGAELTSLARISVQSPAQPVRQREIVTLAANGGKLVLDEGYTDGFLIETLKTTISVTGTGALDVPGLVGALDRYPYGCAEQITSRALPLVYLDAVSLSAGLGADADIRKRVQTAITDVLSRQTSSGSFGLWYPTSGDFWLDSYVTDFLTRAREKGYSVPEVAYGLALDNLGNRIAYAPDFSSGGEDIAYALYVLARAGKASLGDLRYYADVKLASFSSPMAKAQIGAALALYGDKARSDKAFRASVNGLGQDPLAGARTFRRDYGSGIRDEAAVLTLASEAGSSVVNVSRLAVRLGRELGREAHHSTQEQAWSLLAANAMLQRADSLKLSLNGIAYSGPLYRTFSGDALGSKAVTLENQSDESISVALETVGRPVDPQPARVEGYSLSRTYYTIEGDRISPEQVNQNDRMVVVLSVSAEDRSGGRLMVVDPLPAGFEIENPNVRPNGDPKQFPWIGALANTEMTEARADRFAAAVTRSSQDTPGFKLAYMVRAVTPGVYHHPAALVEDMYRPTLRGTTGEGQVEVIGLRR
ncbi:alpha-2-macroglobulin family protein [Coralliovum pocilloporae]|uniref:alpha-2-macroglobulin family protein n=1 Tax=Coralliovum pocilloporae TaxID=3066369 RepID=UPI003306E31D